MEMDRRTNKEKTREREREQTGCTKQRRIPSERYSQTLYFVHSAQRESERERERMFYGAMAFHQLNILSNFIKCCFIKPLTGVPF
jgi:hypothetical protein